jgi:hypothetical protein
LARPERLAVWVVTRSCRRPKTAVLELRRQTAAGNHKLPGVHVYGEEAVQATNGPSKTKEDLSRITPCLRDVLGPNALASAQKLHTAGDTSRYMQYIP